MPLICFKPTNNLTPRTCIDIPIYSLIWPKFPPRSLFDGLQWRLQRLIEAFGPRPHPWQPPNLLALGVRAETLRDLQGLATVDTIVAGLTAEATVGMRENVAAALSRIALPAGVSVDVTSRRS